MDKNQHLPPHLQQLPQQNNQPAAAAAIPPHQQQQQQQNNAAIPPHQQQQQQQKQNPFSISFKTKPPTENASQNAQKPSSQKKKKLQIYPQIPKSQSHPRSVSLSVLIQSLCSHAANTLLTYQDYAASQQQHDSAQNQEIQKQKIQYLFELHEKFLKLYILLKFLTKIDYNQLTELRNQVTQLQELSYCFQFASDSLFFVNDLARKMKEANWDVAVAAHVLVEGKFNLLPKCLEADSYQEFDTTPGSAPARLTMKEESRDEDNDVNMGEANQPSEEKKNSSILFISQSEREQHDMQRLIHDHLLLYLLGTRIPPQMVVQDVKEGMVNVRVPGEFKAQLTLTTRKHLAMPLAVQNGEDSSSAEPKPEDYHLKLVKLRLLTNQVDILSSPVDTNVTQRLAHVIQQRFDQRLHPQPLVDMYEVVHRVSLRLAMDILYQQALQLGRGRLKELIQVKHMFDDQSRELRFVVGYWLGAPDMSLVEDCRARGQRGYTEALGSLVPHDTVSFRNHFSFKPLTSTDSRYQTELEYPSLSGLNSQPAGQILIYVNPDKQCLVVEHEPCQLQCNMELDEFLEQQVSNLSNLNCSAMMMKCIKMHSRERLRTLQRYIERETNLACRLVDDSNLLVSLFELYELNIFVDWRTGKFLFELLYDQQLVCPEEADSNPLVYSAESDPLLSLSEMQDHANYKPHEITDALLLIQCNCILYAYTRAAHILDLDSYPRSLYEKIRRRIMDVHANKLLRDSNCIYITFPNGKNLIHIHTKIVEIEVPSQGGDTTRKVKSVRTVFNLLLMAQNLILHTPSFQGSVVTAANRIDSVSPSHGKKRQKLSENEFATALDHLNTFLRENKLAVVRHTLCQGLISLRAVFHETDDPGLISMNYLIPDETIDHSKTRIFIRTTEQDSWSAEIRCAFPSVFPPENTINENQFQSVQYREGARAKIEIISHDSEDDSTPSGHSVFLHYSTDTDSVNVFYTDLKMLHTMSYLARQLKELEALNIDNRLFPYMTYHVRKCHYSGIIIEYAPRVEGNGNSEAVSEDAGPFYARIRCERGSLRLTLAPSHEMHLLIDLHLRAHRDMSEFLRILESVCVPMIQIHHHLSAPQDHWTILPRNLGQLRLEYRKRGIVYEIRFSHGECLAQELASSGSGFPVLRVRKPTSNIATVVGLISEHAQSKYMCLYFQKRAENNSDLEVLWEDEGKMVMKKGGKDQQPWNFVFQWDPNTYRLQFTVQCPDDALSPQQKQSLQETFLQLYDRKEGLDFRSSLGAFSHLLTVPPAFIRALMEHVSVPDDPLASNSGQNCKLLLQVPSTLSLPPQLAQTVNHNRYASKDRYTYESALYPENNRLHVLYRFSNPQDESEYVDVPIVQETQISFKFFDSPAPDRLGERILSKAQQEKGEQDLLLQHVIGVCKRTPIPELRNLLRV